MSNQLRIAIDISSAARPNRSGVGIYTVKLVEALAEQVGESAQIIAHYYNFLGLQTIAQLPKIPNIHYRVSRFLPEKLINLARRFGINIPFEILTKTHTDLHMFSSYLIHSSLYRTPSLCVIHDLAYIDMPDTVSPKNRQDLIRFVPRSIKYSKSIITISEFTKKQLVKHYDVRPETISIVYPGIDHSHFYPRPIAQIEAIKKQFKLPDDYILFTGNLEPRKNILGTLDAYKQLSTTLSDKYALVLAGSRGWLDQTIQSEIERQQATGAHIVQLGYVDSTQLPALYSGAALFVFPSLYEGFGMPLLEAMACGTPVVAGNNSSQAEVVGDAAMLVNSESAKDISKKMSQVLTGKSLSKSMITKGLNQAKKFSWQKSAAILQDLISSIH